MSFILRYPQDKKEEQVSDKAEAVDNSEAEEAKKQEKKETDELIKKKLNDPKFLDFLQKNPDAADRGADDEYIKEKAKVFEKIQKVKQEVKQFIVGESSSEFGDIVEGTFLAEMERIAINNPADFLDFSNKVSAYLESIKRSNELEALYSQAAKGLGMETDLSLLSLENKVKFIDETHTRFNTLKNGLEEELRTPTGGRPFLSRIPYTKKRADWKMRVSGIKGEIEKLKLEEKKLDKNAILGVLGEVENLKAGLKDNQAFEIIRGEFKKKAIDKLQTAMKAKNYSVLSKDRNILTKVNARESILTEEEFDNLESEINKYSKEDIISDTQGMVENKERVTLNVFEKGIESMKKKGLSLGLTEVECNEQITSSLRAKIEELTKKQDEGQNRVKIILATRILNNLE